MTVVAPRALPPAPTTVRVGTVAVCGLAFGALQAASPLAFWWLDTATVYALGLVLIASVYIGLAVADGRWNTRWWPPFCLVVDWTAAAIIAAEIVVD
jgi:hypothetical protein